MVETAKTRRNMKKFIMPCLIIVCVYLIAIFGFLWARSLWNSNIGSIEPPVIQPLPTLPTTPPSNNPGTAGSNSNASQDDEDNHFERPWDYGLTAPELFTEGDTRDGVWTFLIVGLNEGTNANTVMVASYDANSREAYLISIPRDSLINVNRTGRKLSSSYIAGALGGRGRAGGIATLQRDVMTVIGFVPDFYVIIDYDAFFTIVDAVGGIEIYVPFHMRYDDPYQNLHIDIQPGLQHMNAETALHFSRFRRANPGFRSISDYQRIENQQQVIDAVLRNLLRPSSILRIPEFVDVFNDSVYTNLTVGNMLWFANQLRLIGGTDALTTYTTPMLGTSGEPMWYELLDARGIVSLVNRTVNPFYVDIELRDVSIIIE